MKIITLVVFLLLSAVLGTAQAQISPCYDLVGYCGGDQQCVSDFMPYLYYVCSGDASSMPSWQEKYAIASGGMLPPPGGGNPNPNNAFQTQCPGPPQLPAPQMQSPNYVLYPYLLSHLYPGDYCTSWTIEWSASPR